LAGVSAGKGMKEARVKKHKPRELDLLPVMSLFSILVTIVISMASFEKLGVLELWLPERGQAQSDQPQAVDIDEGLLNLTVIVSDNSITIGAAGGFQPAVYYQEEVQYRSRSDQKVFRKVYIKGEQVRSPSDGKIMGLNEKETIFLNVISKKDSADPGTFLFAAVDNQGLPLMDTSGNWYKEVPPVGASYRTVGDQSFIKMDLGTRQYCKVEKLSAYFEVARVLEKVHQMYSQRSPVPTDVDDIVILAGEDVIYDKIIQMMDACKAAGYDRVALSLMGGQA
jgi:biopolymer transport protein ExbD